MGDYEDDGDSESVGEGLGEKVNFKALFELEDTAVYLFFKKDTLCVLLGPRISEK
jgi:hypothetical protein